MIPEALQPKALLAHPRTLAPHLRTLIVADASTENLDFISSCILDQVQTEAIPSSVFNIWLSLTCKHSWYFPVKALHDPSYGVRAGATKVVKHRLFRGSHWKERGWDVLGGAQGTKDILDKLPLVEVPRLVDAIFGRCDGFSDRKLVSTCIEEFLTLMEDTNRWVSRSLLPHLTFLYALCSAEKVEHLLRSQSRISFKIRSHVPRFHTHLLRLIGVGAVHMPNEVRLGIIKRYRSSLLSSKEPYDPIYYQKRAFDMSPGLLFGMDLLMAMEKEPEQHSNDEIDQWVEEILDKMIREKLPVESILLILNQGSAVCQASALARPKDSVGWLSRGLSQFVIQLWSISRFGRVGGSLSGLMAKYRQRRRTKPLSGHQASLEQCLIQKILHVNDESFSIQQGRPRFTRTIINLLSLVDKQGRMEFLQLLFQHSPSLQIDLTAWPPSKKEEEVMPCWDIDVLRILPPEDSKSLFRRSLHIHHCEEFLPSSQGKDSGSKIPSWEAQCRLWATWESVGSQGDDFPVTRKALDEMKQKSVRAREPPERLRWAKSAIELAVATSCVDIFIQITEWSKRFIRDPLVFSGIMKEITSNCGRMFSCGVDLRRVASVPKSCLLQDAQKGHQFLNDLLKTFLLLLREPWARSSMKKMTGSVPRMLSTVIGRRMDLIRKRPCGESVTESELAEILLNPMIPILIEYEREGNAEGQTAVGWSGISGMMEWRCLPDNPNPMELSFMDRLAKARDELWQQHRVQNDPNVLELSDAWPRGLPIQKLVNSSTWLYHAMRHQNHAPFLSSRANRVLFSPADTVMVVIRNEIEHVGEFVDDLGFIIRALLENDAKPDKAREALRIWEYYSQLLQPHPIYLGLFQDWLVNIIQGQEDMIGVSGLIRPFSLSAIPMVSAVPTGSEIIEWDPHEGEYPLPKTISNDQKEQPDKIPCTILNCRMGGTIPSKAPFVRAWKPRALPEPLSIWSPDLSSLTEDRQDPSRCVQDSVILAALLLLDTYTKTPRILRTKFPDVDFPRYTPVYLADEFITFQTKGKSKEALGRAIEALGHCSKRIPAQILRDLIWSFLDTLKAEPNAPMYSTLLYATFDLIEVLLRTDKPQLAIDVVIRVWKDFTNESSLHRKISLVKLGRIFTPEQAGEMMRGFGGYVCSTLEAQQSQQQSQQQEKEENKAFIKVTTAKMLAQALAQANFLSQSDKMEVLQRMFHSSHQIDIRREVVASILELVEDSDNAEPYKIFTSIASSVAGPNERAGITEAEWDMAENQLGALPYVAPHSERPVLELVVSTAAFKIPEKLRSDYAQNVLIPLVQESTRQHTRWIAAMTARLGLSMSDLKITEQEIGPFSPDLPDQILWKWMKYLPGSYLEKYHRPWALNYLQYGSFSSIDKALEVTVDKPLKDITVRDHWNHFLKSHRARPAIYRLGRLLDSIVEKEVEAANGLSTALVLEDFACRAEIISKNPVKYNEALKQYTVRPEYTLELLRALRTSRVASIFAVEDTVYKATVYNDLTDAMARTVGIFEDVRKEGWSAEFTGGYPATLPSTFEYDVLMLPSPIYNPMASESNLAADIFTSAILDLIRKYSRGPILLMKFDSLQPVVREVPTADLKASTLRLGGAQPTEHDSLVMWARVKLACLLLQKVQSNSKPLDEDMLGMIDEWKNSDVEIVRQIGWEC